MIEIEKIRTIRQQSYISIYKTGLISLNKELLKSLSLKEGDNIVFTIDYHGDWFFCVGKKSKNSFKLKGEHGRLKFNSASLADKFYKQFDLLEGSYKIPVVTEAIIWDNEKYYSLLTARAEWIVQIKSK